MATNFNNDAPLKQALIGLPKKYPRSQLPSTPQLIQQRYLKIDLVQSHSMFIMESRWESKLSASGIHFNYENGMAETNFRQVKSCVLTFICLFLFPCEQPAALTALLKEPGPLLSSGRKKFLQFEQIKNPFFEEITWFIGSLSWNPGLVSICTCGTIVPVCQRHAWQDAQRFEVGGRASQKTHALASALAQPQEFAPQLSVVRR